MISWNLKISHSLSDDVDIIFSEATKPCRKVRILMARMRKRSNEEKW